MFLSIGLRFRADVEALNMAETIGDVSRHRRAPVLVRDKDAFKLIYVPVISGESIAHAIQYNLVKVAKPIYSGNPPIDPWSLRGEFIKFGDNNHLTPSLREIVKNMKKMKPEEFQHQFEKTAIRESIVADIGGFLYTAGTPVRRTSIFQVGYAVPVEEAVRQSMIEAQLHTRSGLSGIEAQGESRGKQADVEKGIQKAQMLYYVEIASSVYGLTINAEIDRIGRTSMIRIEDAVDEEEKARRIKAFIKALLVTLGEKQFGAKLSRFTPVMEPISAVAVISQPLPFTVTAPQKKGYIEETIKRAEKYTNILKTHGIEEKIKIITYNYPEYPENKPLLEELFDEILREAAK